MTVCWVITDGAAGNRNQAIALAQGLGLAPQVFDIRLRRPWSWLAPFAPRDPRAALAVVPDGFAPPWPDLAIGCGRASAGLVLALKQASGGRARALQILDPRWRRARFDALVLPEHDGLAGGNVITCTGALHRIDDAWLAEGRARFPAPGGLPPPRTAVLVGGPVAGVPLDAAYIDGLLAVLASWQHDEGGSFLVTCSRRTPPALAQRLRAAFAAWPGVFWGGDGLDTDPAANPYQGLLGWADRIVVTPDSSNLLAEACAVGVPVQVHLPDTLRLRGKRQRLLRRLRDAGHVVPLRTPPAATAATPLRELPAIAAALRARLGWPA